MMLRSLLVVSCLLPALPAQRGEKPVPTKPDPPAVVKPDPPAGEFSDAGESMEGSERGTAKFRAEGEPLGGARRGAANFCQFHVHTRPTKLMPGETGKLIVTAVLKGQAVMPSPAPLEVTSAAEQGVFTLGAAEILPAGLGRHATAYLGRQVYDNYAMLEMPITASTQAQVGQVHNVSVEMKFDLFDGTTAQSIGTFVDRAMGRVEIGRSYDPAVKGGYTPPVTAEPAPAQAEPAGRADPGEAAPAHDVEALGGAAAQVVTPEPPPEDETATPTADPAVTPRIRDDDSGLWILLAGGGALLVGVLLLVFKRR